MVAGRRNSGTGGKCAIAEAANGQLFRFVRYSHIFASVVREILETKTLAEVSPDPLSLTQFHLLKLLTLNGDHHVREVADFLGVSPPAATQNIDKLERLGLVVRVPSRGDRRAILLSPSPKGRRLVHRYEDLNRQRLAAVVDEFTLEEIEQLSSLLERFSLRVLHHDQSSDDLCLRCAAYWEQDCPVGVLRGGCPYQEVRRSKQPPSKRGPA